MYIYIILLWFKFLATATCPDIFQAALHMPCNSFWLGIAQYYVSAMTQIIYVTHWDYVHKVNISIIVRIYKTFAICKLHEIPNNYS